MQFYSELWLKQDVLEMVMANSVSSWKHTKEGLRERTDKKDTKIQTI